MKLLHADVSYITATACALWWRHWQHVNCWSSGRRG